MGQIHWGTDLLAEEEKTLENPKKKAPANCSLSACVRSGCRGLFPTILLLVTASRSGICGQLFATPPISPSSGGGGGGIKHNLWRLEYKFWGKMWNPPPAASGGTWVTAWSLCAVTLNLALCGSSILRGHRGAVGSPFRFQIPNSQGYRQVGFSHYTLAFLFQCEEPPFSEISNS